MPNDIIITRLPQVLLTVRQAAEALAIGETRCWDLVRERKIVAVRVGRSTRIPGAEVLDFAQRLVNEQAGK